MLRHSVLEDDAADDDGDGGREVAHEAEGCCGGGDVARLNERLKSNQGSLEIRTDA